MKKIIMFLFFMGLVLAVRNFTYAADEVVGASDFSFVQLSDTHWGFNNPVINPDWAGILKKAIVAINNLEPPPDFVIFTGDLTHTTDDPKERRKRLKELHDIAMALKVKDIKFMPGEHDAGLDNGKVYRQIFEKTYYTFKHKGVNFIVIDNVSDPTSSIGQVQLQWLSDELKKLDRGSKIVVFAHRPLFDLYPQWDWWTSDGAKAMELLTPYKNVTIFYGHIHQEHHYMNGNIPNHAAKGMMYPLPAAGSVPKKAPIPWDPSRPYAGLGFRSVLVKANSPELILTEYAMSDIVKEQQATQKQDDAVIKITAKKFEFSPSQITIKKGMPVVLELTSLDVMHGFNCPGLGIRADVRPGTVSAIHLVAQKTGTYEFFCDIFCGEGHSDMRGRIIVEE
jgi:plastocyanin